MRLACIPAPLRQGGGRTRAFPVRPRSSCTSASRKLIFTKANIWSVKLLSPQVSPVFLLRLVITLCFQKMLITFRPCSVIMWMNMEMSLDQTLTHERILARKGPISMARGCRMPCFSEAVTRCIRATSRHSPRPTVASVCRDRWLLDFLRTLLSELR